jgi:hypothetical protein
MAIPLNQLLQAFSQQLIISNFLIKPKISVMKSKPVPFLLFKTVDVISPMRVSEEYEMPGLDITRHDESL